MSVAYKKEIPLNQPPMFFTLMAALMMGTIFWKIGAKRSTTTGLIQTVLGAMNSAVLFIGMNNAGTVQPIVTVERIVFYQEKAARIYSPIPYAIAQVVTEIPCVLFQSTFYTAIVYPMMGFQWTAAKFSWFLFISFFTFLYCTYYGMMAVASRAVK